MEYVHVGATLALIQDVLTEAVLSHPRLSLGRKMGLVKALGKVIWIQNDLFAKWYVRDGEEYTDGVDYSKLIEREGYLHGHKVLGLHENGSESEMSETTEGTDGAEMDPKGKGIGAPEGVCPFAAMSRSMGGLKVSGGSGIPMPAPKGEH